MSKSIPKKYNQNQLTKIFITTIGLKPPLSSELKYKIWFNPTDNSSLRLNLEGYRFMMQVLKIKPYEFDFGLPLSNRNLLQLERFFQSMYYINKQKIIVFEEEEAIMLTLHGNNLFQYLDNLETCNIDQNPN